MKKIISILLLFISTINFSYGGCFYKDKEDYQVESSNPCISAIIVTTCQAQVLLLLKSECGNKYYIYNEEKEKLELNSDISWPYNKSYILEDKKYDYIPEEKFKWNRKIVNIDNDEDIIYIKGINLLNGSFLNKYLNEIILLTIITLMLVIILLLKISNKLNSKKE